MSEGKRHVSLRERHGYVSPLRVSISRGVSTHLAYALWDWCRRQELVGAAKKLPPDERPLSQRAHRMCLALKLTTGERISDLKETVFRDVDVLLDMADWLLRENYVAKRHSGPLLNMRVDLFGKPRFASPLEEINSLLADADSAWKVADPPDHLVLRLPDSLEKEFRSAVDIGDEASGHLARGFEAAWTRKKSSEVVAYDGAIKALECILAPIVTPDDPKPTLGKIIATLGDKPEKWDTRFGSDTTVDSLRSLLNEVWQLQSRHAGAPPNTLEEAQDAITIAGAVVSLLQRGFLEQVENLTSEEEEEDLRVAEEATSRYRAMKPEEATPYEEYAASRAAATKAE